MKYQMEHVKYLVEIVGGKTIVEITNLVNTKFDIDLKVSQVRSFYKNRHIKIGCMVARESNVFPKIICDFIESNSQGMTAQDLTVQINEVFGTEYKVNQIRSYKKNHKIVSGVDMTFKKGCVSHNKGKIGMRIPGSEKGWFKSGAIPHNILMIGTEITTEDGYIKVKVAEPNVWRFKHRLIWEAERGPIDSGYKIIFLDNNKLNTDIENLEIVSNSVMSILNRKNLRFDVPEITSVSVTLAKVIAARMRILHKKEMGNNDKRVIRT